MSNFKDNTKTGDLERQYRGAKNSLPKRKSYRSMDGLAARQREYFKTHPEGFMGIRLIAEKLNVRTFDELKNSTFETLVEFINYLGTSRYYLIDADCYYNVSSGSTSRLYRQRIKQVNGG